MPIALARDSEDRAKSKVCTIAESANRPHRPAIAVTFASRGAGTRWSSSSIDPDYNALVKIGTRQMWAKLVCEVPALAGSRACFIVTLPLIADRDDIPSKCDD